MQVNDRYTDRKSGKGKREMRRREERRITGLRKGAPRITSEERTAGGNKCVLVYDKNSGNERTDGKTTTTTF